MLGFALPVAVYVWFLHHYAMNVVSADQWSDVEVIRASYDGHLGLATLWAQHNENRMLFPNLLVLAMSRLDAFNVSAEEYLSAVLLLASVAMIIATHRRRVPARPLIVYCPVVFLMLSVVQAENILWGFQLAWYLILVTLAGVLFLLDRPALPVVALVGAMVCAVGGSFSSVQGLFIWVAGLLLLFYRRRSPGFMVAWVAGGVLTTVLYFYNFNSHAAVAPGLTPFDLPGRAVRFFFESLGDVLGVPLRTDGVGTTLITALGCAILLLALYSLWSGGRHRRSDSAEPVGMALTVFGLLFALSTTWGRGWAGPAAASASRYTTYDLLVLVGAYLTFIGRPAPEAPLRGTARTVSGLVGGALACVIALVTVFGFVNGVRWAWSSQRPIQAAVTVDVDHIPDPVVKRLLDPALPADQLRADTHVLAAHGLSLFSDPQGVARYRRLAALDTSYGLFKYAPPPPTAMVLPHRGAVVSGTTLLGASAARSLDPVGVAFVLTGNAQPPRQFAGKSTVLGWFTRWNTASVPNGTYHLMSVVAGRGGVRTESRPIMVIVRNGS